MFSIIFNLLKKRNNLKKCYDHIISLGYNCEIMFRFVKYFKFEESNLFNWAYSHNIDSVINAIANCNKLGSASFHYEGYLYTCKYSKIHFHGNTPMNKLKDNPSVQAEDIKNLEEKIPYLAEKFINILNSDNRKLYIYKVKSNQIDQNINKKIEHLKQTLIDCGGKNFDLLIISEEKYQNTFKEAAKHGYIYRSVKFFAPDKDVTNKKYLKNGWNKIFDEFYTKKPIIIKKKKYKF